MKAFGLQLTLLDDVVLSERPASAGGHASLDYVPGAALLGAAAARLYAQLGPEAAYVVFHSGQVRFGNALPATGERLCAPMPFCWHARKLDRAMVEQRLLGERLLNFQHERAFADHAQPRQLREGYVRGDGRVVRPVKLLRMKTAIDPQSGRALEAQLFGYEALAAGTTLLARVEADDAVDATLFDKVRAALDGELLLGRSRSAEYGRARASIVAPPEFAAGAVAGQTELTLWCLSDLAVADGWGTPTLEPRPEWLGLPKGCWRPEQSFLRFRRYAPFNAARRLPDMERLVIRQGSVIRLEFDAPLSEADAQRLAQGLGLHREAGLGRVWANPALLATASPRFDAPYPENGEVTPAPANERPALLAWLQARRDEAAQRGDFSQQAQVVASRLHELYASARRSMGRPAHVEVGPSASQWGTVLAVAKSLRPGESIAARLFEGESAAVKDSMPGWSDHFVREMNGQPVRQRFYDWLKHEVKPGSDPRFVAELARRAQSFLRERRQDRKEAQR
ncbi:MAG: hypothetical protein AB1697_04815 [Pseudomonadota bacterium]